jgi:hypothetical protein
MKKMVSVRPTRAMAAHEGERRHCVGRFYGAKTDGAKTGIASVDFIGAKTGIASVDFIAVAARFGPKSAGLALGE